MKQRTVAAVKVAVTLGMLILERADQQSFTMQSADRSTLYSNRVDHDL